MRGLVVAYRLPGHAVTVFVVVPQRGDTPCCWIAGSLDYQLVAGARYNLFTPVAQNVAQEAGVVLRRVVQVTLSHPAAAICKAAVCAYLFLSGELIDGRITLYAWRIHKFVQQVTIPVYAHVDIVVAITAKAVDDLICHQTDTVTRDADSTGIAVLEIAGHAAAVVRTAASRIAQCLCGSSGIGYAR